jgi:hypothetical protein
MIDPLLRRGRHLDPIPPPRKVTIGTDQIGQYHVYARSIPGAFHRTWDMGLPSQPEKLPYHSGFYTVFTSIFSSLEDDISGNAGKGS